MTLKLQIWIFDTFFLTWNRTNDCMTAIFPQTWTNTCLRYYWWKDFTSNLENISIWKCFFRRGRPSNKLVSSITWSWRWARAWATARQQIIAPWVRPLDYDLSLYSVSCLINNKHTYRVSQKNALSECCWSHSALAQSQVAGTPCVWKSICWSFLTKTKPDQAGIFMVKFSHTALNLVMILFY